MERDRSEVVESPLVEDFLDCERLGSDSEEASSSSSSSSTPSGSPRRSFKRLQIAVDMTSAQYLMPSAHHHHDSLPGSTACTSGPASVAYSSPDLDPYSAISGVSSFNYPAAADSTLLTPVSGAGSPPLQHRATSKPPMRNYHSQSAIPGPQAPTPPNSSKMYYSGYDVNTSSQGSSPMTVHPAATEGTHFDISYMAHSPPTSHHPSSPKSDVPPPINPYLGHFTVSDTNNGELTHHTFEEYHAFNVNVGPSATYLGQPPHMHHRMSSNGGHAPVLTQPNPSHFRPHTTPRIGGIEDLRDPSVLLGGYPSHTALSPGRRPQQRKKPSPARKPARTPKTTPQIGSDSGANGQLDDDDQDELTLRDDAPDDDKYLFQLRKEFISEKGKGMWEEMKAKYSEKHQGNWEKAALQMKVSRAVAKYGVWPKREIERLKEAHRYYEEKRYQLILARMKESGGCRVWDWKPQHIEAMLVKLGMEEHTVDEKTGARRRKNKTARRRATSQNSHHHASVMGDWSNGLGLHHPAFQGHAHHVAAAAAARQASYDMISDDASTAPTFSSEQENDYLDQIFNKSAKVEGSMSPEIMDLTYENDAASQHSTVCEPSHHRSERVARQACEQMMQTRATYAQ